jgi:hypothetical protein
MASLTVGPSNPSVDPTRSRDGAAEFEIDEERHRNRVNLLAAVVAVLLIAAGWWIVNSLVETQRAQSCYATGTLYCSLI